MPSVSTYNILAACVALICFGEDTHAFGLYRPPSVVISSLPLHAINRNATETDEKAVAMISLEKLRKRQRDEAQETERLIEQFSEALSTDTKSLNDLIQQGTRASSILAAFDYGFQSRSAGASAKLEQTVKEASGQLESYGGPPKSFFSLGVEQFNRNLDAMRGEYKDEEPQVLKPDQKSARKILKQLTLNTTAIWEREKKQISQMPQPPLIIQIPYNVLCLMLDFIFEGRYTPARFFYLETVARMPYFSYISCLHLYETLGFWRNSADMKRVHFAEEWNEFHHLLIMESIGGDQRWWVRFLAQHSAIAYYLILVHLFAISPTLSYKFSEMLETHAVHTYSQFLDENEELLKQLPPPVAAVDYYTIGAFDPLFEEYKTNPDINNKLLIHQQGSINSPNVVRSLYDVFARIRDDEAEHVKTMEACLDPQVVVRSAAAEKNFLLAAAGAALVAYLATAGGGLIPEDLVDVSLAEEVEDGIPILLEEGGTIAFLINAVKQIFERIL